MGARLPLGMRVPSRTPLSGRSASTTLVRFTTTAAEGDTGTAAGAAGRGAGAGSGAGWLRLSAAATVISLVIAYPWNILQLWEFILPALYKEERRALGWWLLSSSFLFAAGVCFCVFFILPLLMGFSSEFATVELKPMIGLAGFLNLSGWLMLAFGLMFQVPILVLLAVRFGVISYESLRKKRPYVMVGILFMSAVLTPPDVVSQVLLAVPTWLLFELGLLISKRMEKDKNEQT